MVSGVAEGGMADHCGVWEGDEVIRVNGRGVKEAGWVGTRSSLDGEKFNLLSKSSCWLLSAWDSMWCLKIQLEINSLFFSSQCFSHT